MILTLDTATWRIIDADGTPLLGECLRCGKCCEAIGCPELIYESHEYRIEAVCKIYNRRPFWCAVWPKPTDSIPDGCGFRYG